MMPMTKWVKRLVIANVVMFLASQAYPELYQGLMLVPALVVYRPWTVVTYMFLHANVTHIFFNMLVLFFFGPRVEIRLGEKRFLWLYFLSGIGGAVGSFVFARSAAVIGASAAVYGVLLAFAMFWPKEKILLFFIIPIDAWLLVAGAVVLSLYMGITGTEAGVAHFAHLGGLATGFLYLKWSDWHMGASQRAFKRAMSPQPAAGVGDRGALDRWRSISVEGLHELNREEIVRLVDKAERDGPRSLTEVERQFLDRMSGT